MQNLKPLASLYSRTGRFESYLVANPKDRFFSYDEAQLRDWDTINVKSRCCMAKPTKWPVCQAKTQISLGICPVWSVFNVHMKKH